MCSFRVKFFIFLISINAHDFLSFASAAVVVDTTFVTVPSDSTETSTTQISALPLCNELNVMPNINLLQLSGIWYEFARKGYGTYVQNLQCLEMNLSFMNGTAMVFQTFAANLSTVDEQNIYEYIVKYDRTNPSDYNITSTSYSYLPVPTYKILDTDYTNYLVVCSYLEMLANSAAAFVYFRDRQTTDNEVYAVVNEAATKYEDFQDLNLVYQGPKCVSGSQPLSNGILSSLLLSLLVPYCLSYFFKE